MNCPRCKSPRIQLGFHETPRALRFVGVHDLLCNNCSKEFRGFAVPGMVSRQPSKKKEIPGNRQLAPRVKVKLPVEVSAAPANASAISPQYAPSLPGLTKDISKVGVSLLLPTLNFCDQNFAEKGRRLRVTLTTPSGIIRLQIAVVRSEEVPTRTKLPWLIGGRITKISETDRQLLNTYLDRLS